LSAVAAMVLPEPEETVKPLRESFAIKGKPVILVVEDHPDNLTTVKALLGNEYEILEAIDGKEGLAVVQRHTPDIIFMDIGLPGMDGIEVFKTMRKNARLRHIPIVALTASAMTTDREAILAHGFDAYIAKPIDKKLFFKTINELLYGK
jgi:CheY-like chemotaxis protein